MVVFWFRRDLRLDDNRAFFEALTSNSDVLTIFIFDENILNNLPKDDARILFINLYQISMPI
jgi:deoxyribodipyrimidine photo-lyase